MDELTLVLEKAADESMTEYFQHIVEGILNSPRRYPNLHISNLTSTSKTENVDKLIENQIEIELLKADNWILPEIAARDAIKGMMKLKTIIATDCAIQRSSTNDINYGRLQLRTLETSLHNLQQLHLVSCDGKFLESVFISAKNLTEFEVEIDKRWSNSNLMTLEQFIINQMELKKLKIVNSSCALPLFTSNRIAQFQLESLALECVLLVKNVFVNQTELREVKLSMNQMSGQMIYETLIRGIFENNKQLAKLKIEMNDCNGAHFFDIIEKNENIKSLTFQETSQVGHRSSFPSLVHILPKLKQLELKCTGEFGEDSKYVDKISNLRLLESLTLANVDGDALTELIVSSGSLKEVKLKVKLQEFLPITLFISKHHLKRLELISTNFKFNTKHCKSIRNMGSLERLGIALLEHGEVEECIEVLKNAASLKTITLSVHQITPSITRKLDEKKIKLYTFAD